MASAAPSRLSRLLALVPYFLAHDGIPIDQAAADLGVTVRQLTKDLEQLFVCGLPGYYPDDLIELEFSEGHVHVGFAAGMDRPLRLTPTEASIMLVALRALVDTPGIVDREAAGRAIAKIEQAVGTPAPDAQGGHGRTSVASASGAELTESPRYRTVREAVRADRALSLNYYSATRDVVTRRIVDPISLQAVDNHTYLQAWCRESEGVRLFRFDRIDDAEMLDEPAAPPEQARHSPQSPILAGNPDLPTALIDIDPSELWILDYYTVEPLEPIESRPDPTLPVRARIVYGSPRWLTRFLLGFGGRIRVVDDADLAAAIGEDAARALARYDDHRAD
ncbi:helix-turn-helix transcriptional regulator [Gordonia sp. DT30]|uniref:helix-turn-helix transcriptional regulator n=1 Tax=unclassified Gordonia (in: high G+C Gram-positive bacteria) TaxID=2657482 RepID=UPI003CF4897C